MSDQPPPSASSFTSTPASFTMGSAEAQPPRRDAQIQATTSLDDGPKNIPVAPPTAAPVPGSANATATTTIPTPVPLAPVAEGKVTLERINSGTKRTFFETRSGTGSRSRQSFTDKKKSNSGLMGASELPLTPNIKSARESDLRSIEEQMIEVHTQNSHALSWEQVLTLLETNAEKGLTKEEASLRLQKFGKNKLAEAPPEPFWHKVFRQINSILIYILLVAAIIAGGFQEWAEFGLILGVVIFNVLIGLFQEGKAEKATAALKAMLSSNATVIRDGQRMEVKSEEVVPGDVVFVESGNKVPADLRLVSVSNLAIQEAMLTGESLPVNKKTQALSLKIGLGDRKNMAFSATNVIKGQATGIVVATGDETEIGKINMSVSEVKEEKTQLIKQVDAFGVWIGLMVLPIALASFLLAYFNPGPKQYNISYAFVEAVAIAVAIIPEGLPAIITITLSLGTSYMAKHNAIVKALPSVETLGSVMVICSDKTGTLTKNEMTVVASRTSSQLYKVSQVGYDPTGGKIEVDTESTTTTTSTMEEDKALPILIRGSILCNDSRIERAPAPKDKNGKETASGRVLPVGDPTEVALVTFAEKANVLALDERSKSARIGVIPFESEHKFMCTFHAHPDDKSKVVMYAKGAPDRLVVRCSTQLNGSNGSIEPISVEFWQQQAMELSSKGLRCLAICTATLDSTLLADAVNKGSLFVTASPEPFLCFLGLAAIMDPPRQECVVAIKEAHGAGVGVKMITGDHPATAKSIGQQLGIVDEEHDMVLTGPELDAMSMEQLRQVVKRCNVYARASPENKISIVRALQAEGIVCSMTGDGVNDAPALRAANIGVAMGITGTDVSKDAAKMILTDDNFATILVAVKEGRRVWDNLKKLLVFNQPAAFAQGGVVFFALCLQWTTVPLTAIQILYVNMITACTMGIMLAVEPAEPDIMQRPPRPSTSRLIGLFFYWRTCFVATVFILFVLGAVAWLNAISPPYTVLTTTNTTLNGVTVSNTTNTTIYAASEDMQHAIALNTLVFCEITYAFNCRFLKESSLHYRIFFGNVTAWICALVMISLQMLITYVPGLNTFFSMSDGMNGWAWGITILFAICSFLIIEVEKALSEPLKPYTKPVITKLDKMFCSWRCRRVKCRCCEEIDYVPHEEPKKQERLPPKLKQGGSLRFIPDDMVKDAV